MTEFEQLKADFKRVYIHHFGVESWNQAINDKSLPKWLDYTYLDAVEFKTVPLKRGKKNV